MADEKPTESKDGDNKSVSELTQMVDRLEKANEESKKLIARQEELYARMALGGKSTVAPPETPKPVSNKDYAKALTEGKILK